MNLVFFFWNRATWLYAGEKRRARRRTALLMFLLSFWKALTVEFPVSGPHFFRTKNIHSLRCSICNILLYFRDIIRVKSYKITDARDCDTVN